MNNSLFRPEVLALSAYKVADSQNLIKLDAMENPYRWPEAIIKQWQTELADCAINRYPDPEAKSLVDILRQTNQIPDSASLLLGNGSDEIIQILLMALNPGAHVLAPEPTFVMYKQIALSLGLNFHGIPLLADSFELDLAAMQAAIEQHQPAIIFLSYPNNPTGNLFNADSIKAILNQTQGLVIVDEAYAPFADASFMGELPNYPNLLVMRTLSKLGLAGLRLGFMAGSADLIEQFNKIRLPYNINSLTQLTAEFALKHIDFLIAQTTELCEQRAIMLNALTNIEAVTAYPSAANFILFKTGQHNATAVFEKIKQQGVLIKNLSPQGGLLTHCLRVTIGTPEENKAFLAALTTALQEG